MADYVARYGVWVLSRSITTTMPRLRRSRHGVGRPQSAPASPVQRPNICRKQEKNQKPVRRDISRKKELFSQHPKSILVTPSKNGQNRFQDPLQSETLPAGGDREGRLLDLSYPAKERQRETPFARHDDGRRHHQWLPLSSHDRARWP